MVAHTGFEPVISSLRGRCPKPLDECATVRLAGEEGFEPSLTDPESAVLPLDDSPARVDYNIGLDLRAIQNQLTPKT
jgi:hypothetical protein